MDSERWQRVLQLFPAAAELEGPEREDFLDQHVAGEPDVRREIEAMLAAHEKEEGLHLEATLLGEGSQRWGVGSTIGAYRLEKLLGRGGMAEVWSARRQDEQFQHHVAIKLVRWGLLGAELEQRFKLERQILARLSHPNIARLLDGGVAGGGTSYLVMELVDGAPLVEWCNRQKLSIEQRLDLFVTVCRAVHYAHRNLVVHRDLKPSNILVTEAGETKLLDFGIAKLLDPEGAELTAPHTRTALRLMTPEYASPEQIRGEAITTATDVYALGLVLYELLCGHHPYRRPELNRRQLEEMVCVQEPSRPSTAIEEASEAEAIERQSQPERLRRRLRGDLDTIVLYALRKEPERRYGSAEQMAEDIRRHLQGKPVAARRDTLAYRASKFFARHPVGTTLAVVFAVVLVAFSAVTLVQSRTITEERDTARNERDKAREVTTLLLDLFDTDPYASEDEGKDSLTVRELLARSEEEVSNSLDTQPEVRAALLALLGRLYGNLGQFDRALELSREALELRLALFGETHDQVGESLNYVATVHQRRGEYGRAEELFRRALSVRESLHGEADLTVAESANNLAVLLDDQAHAGDHDEIRRLHERALRIRRQLLSDNDLEVAQSYNNLAAFLGFRGHRDPELAERYMRTALRIRIDRLGSDHPSVANTRHNLGQLLRELGQPAEAEAMFEDAIRSWSVALGPDHPHVSAGLYGLSEALVDRGDLQGAEDALRRSHEIDTATLPSNHPFLAQGAAELGSLLLRMQRPEESEPYLRHALEIHRQRGEVAQEEGLEVLADLATTLIRLDRFAAAEPLLLERHRLIEAKTEVKAGELAESRGRLAELYSDWGRLDEATRYRSSQ